MRSVSRIKLSQGVLGHYSKVLDIYALVSHIPLSSHYALYSLDLDIFELS